MKLYSIYTESHKVLKDKYFLPSIKDDYKLILEEREQKSLTSNYMEEGWFETMEYKVDLILRAIRENWNKIFFHCDVDVQFLGKTEDIILECMKGKDMVFQLDNPDGQICAGLFAARGNKRTQKLWLDIKEQLCKGNKHDQDLLNDFLRKKLNAPSKLLEKVWRKIGINEKIFNQMLFVKNVYGIRWDYLPDNFFGGGTFSGKRWEPGEQLIIPKNPLMHHANWTVGVDNKIKQLEYVKRSVNI